MCRRVTFAGTCTRCGESNMWEDLSQQLWCLDAKNNGEFGDCVKGVYPEQHAFDQECDRCTEEDEGVGDVGDEDQHGNNMSSAGGKREEQAKASVQKRHKISNEVMRA